MSRLKTLNKTISAILVNGGAKQISEATIVSNKDDTCRWSQNLIQLPNGERYLIKVSPVGKI